jgi:uncharacterized LabA/DUF88 family protein
MSIYVYVDGESHYLRSEKCWQTINNDPSLSLETANPTKRPAALVQSLLTKSAQTLTFHAKGKVFWDAHCVNDFVLHSAGLPDQISARIISRATYFTSLVGDDDALHSLRLLIRWAGLEPVVLPEPSALAAQRQNVLTKQGLIEKPKGVDIALSVRLLEDAQHGNFDFCYLFTSDVDFLPAIEAVRRMGKRVCVAGFRQGLGNRSALEYAPDLFIDLGQYMSDRYSINSSGGLGKAARAPSHQQYRS